MDLKIGDRVFYTRSNGLRPAATVVGTAEDGLLHLEYYRSPSPLPSQVHTGHLIALHLHCPTHSQVPPQRPLVLHHCHKNREGPPQGPLQSTLGCLILRVFPRGVPRGSLGGT